MHPHTIKTKKELHIQIMLCVTVHCMLHFSKWSATTHITPRMKKRKRNQIVRSCFTNELVHITIRKLFSHSAVRSGQCAVSTTRLVGYDQGYLLFLVNSDTLCISEINGNICLPCTWIPLPAQTHATSTSMGTEEVSCFQMSADAVAVLDVQAQLLCILSLCVFECVLGWGMCVCVCIGVG